jgi:hypothetical protein
VNEEPLEVDLQNIFFVFFSSLSKLSKPPNKNVRTVKSREELLADCRLRDGEKLFHPSTSLSRFRNKKTHSSASIKTSPLASDKTVFSLVSGVLMRARSVGPNDDSQKTIKSSQPRGEDEK